MNDVQACYILECMTLPDNVSEKLRLEVKEALSIAREAILHKRKELKLSDSELQMIRTGLDTAMQESQLPDRGEDGYEDVLKLMYKLGIATQEDVFCPKCGESTSFMIYGGFNGSYGVFTCNNCGFQFEDKYNMATEKDWEEFTERTKDIIW